MVPSSGWVLLGVGWGLLPPPPPLPLPHSKALLPSVPRPPCTAHEVVFVNARFYLSFLVEGGALIFHVLASGAFIYELHNGVCESFSITAYLLVRSTQQPQHNQTMPRVLGGPRDCQSVTVAARVGWAAFKSWHIIFHMAL